MNTNSGQEESNRAAQDWLRRFDKQATNRLMSLQRHTQNYLRTQRAQDSQPQPEQKIRKILVYGAGVLGSLYAGKLHQAGYNVILLARGLRLEELRKNGLTLIEDGTTILQQIPIRVTDELFPEDPYDLVLVVVRKNQLPSVLPALAANQNTPNVLFLVNNAEGPAPLVEALGSERVMLGFPGAGGRREEGVVRYRLASRIQPTTIGELDGQQTERLEQVARVFKHAHLPVAICDHMDAWLKTHVALVSPIANAIYLAGGSNYRLANTRDGLVLMVRAVKEGLRVLQALGIPITPAGYKALLWLPEPLLVGILHKRLATPGAELILAHHANTARDEMQTLAEEFHELARQSGRQTPAIDALYGYLDPSTPPLPEAQANLRLDWRSIAVTGAAAAGVLVSAGLLIGWQLKRQKK